MNKLILTAIFAFALNLFLSAQAPNNDAPCDASYLSCGIPISGTTVGATISIGSPSCSFGQAKDVFYSIYAQTERDYTVTLNGPFYNGAIAVYTGTCDGSLTEIACNNGFGSNLTVSFSVFSNQDVLIQTFSGFGSTGTFEIEIDCSQPVNNLPCDAITILCGDNLSGNSVNATQGKGNPSCAFSNGSIQDVYYKFNAGEGSTYTVSVNGSNYDGVLGLYTGTCSGGLIEVACANTSTIPGVAETVTFTATQSSTILIQTYDWNHTGGEYTISLTCDFPNDEPCNATEITCGLLIGGTTVGATQSSLGQPSCSSGSQEDVFYKIEALAGIDYTVTVNGTNYNGVLAAYTGSCSGTLTEIDCSNIGLLGNTAETIDFSVAFDQTVYIRTYDYFSSGGDFDLHLTCENLPYDEPCDARYLVCGESFSGSSAGATTSAAPSPSCAGLNGRKDIFFKFLAYANLDYSVTVNGDNYNPLIAAYTGSCDGSLTEIDCARSNSFQNGIAQTVNINVPTDQFITLQVYDVITAFGTASDYTITLACPIPENDLCVDATELIINAPPQEATNYNANGSPDISIDCGFDEEYTSNNDVWFYFTAPSSGVVAIETFEGTLLDSQLQVLDACGGNVIACNEDGNGLMSKIYVDCNSYTPGETYLVQVDGWYGGAGTFSISVTTSICLSPPNDACANAMVLDINNPGLCPANQVEGNTAFTIPSNPDACDPDAPDLYYEFNSGENSEVVINLEAITAEDLVLSIFESSCSSIAVYCNVGTNQSSTITVNPNSTYYARVHTRLGYQTGTFNICIEEVPELIVINGTISGWNNSCAARDVQVSMLSLPLGTIGVYTATVYPDGSFTVISDEFLPGDYNILVKVNGALAVLSEDVVLNGGANSFTTGPVVLGDINNNNVINVLDLSVFSASFGTTSASPGYNFLADLNCDGVINIFDVSILGAGFNKTGATI